MTPLNKEVDQIVNSVLLAIYLTEHVFSRSDYGYGATSAEFNVFWMGGSPTHPVRLRIIVFFTSDIFKFQRKIDLNTVHWELLNESIEKQDSKRKKLLLWKCMRITSPPVTTSPSQPRPAVEGSHLRASASLSQPQSTPAILNQPESDPSRMKLELNSNDIRIQIAQRNSPTIYSLLYNIL